MSETEKLRVLLAEARDSVALLVAEYEAFGQKARLIEPERQLVARINAALAEPVTAEYSQDEVNAMTTDMIAVREEAERAAYQRGAEAMREAAAEWFAGDIERAAAGAHEAYQREAHRRGDVRHADAYADLPDATKEWDRVLCRWAAREIRAMPIPEDKR